MASLSFSKSIVKFNSYSQSRDKIYRTIQYGSRLVLWHLARQSIHGTFEEKLKNLEAALALSRKLFRMGNSLDFIHRAMDAVKMTNTTERNLTIIAHLMKAVWLILDHLIWFNKVKIVQIDIAFWTKQSSRAWLIGLVASTIFDLLRLQQLQRKLDSAALQSHTTGRTETLDQVKLEMRNMRMTFWRDLCDIFIPVSGLGYVNSGIGAACGLLSSLIGFKQEWEKNVQPYKLRSP